MDLDHSLLICHIGQVQRYDGVVQIRHRRRILKLKLTRLILGGTGFDPEVKQVVSLTI
jgi:hypothetical protein